MRRKTKPLIDDGVFTDAVRNLYSLATDENIAALQGRDRRRVEARIAWVDRAIEDGLPADVVSTRASGGLVLLKRGLKDLTISLAVNSDAAASNAS